MCGLLGQQKNIGINTINQAAHYLRCYKNMPKKRKIHLFVVIRLYKNMLSQHLIVDPWEWNGIFSSGLFAAMGQRST